MHPLCRSVTVFVALLGGLSGAQAYDEPFYARVLASGDIDDPATRTTSIDAGPRAVAANAGSFWCPVSGWGCGISIAPGGGGGAGVASADPFAGTIRAKAGALNYPEAERVHWTVDLGFGPFEYYPSYWKSGLVETYSRAVWRIESATLPVGTPVTIGASLAVQGDLLGGPAASYSAAMLVNLKADTDRWLQGTEYINYGSALDLIALGWADGRTLSASAITGVPDVDVDASQVWSKSFAVGDVVVVETMLNSFAGAPNVGGSIGLFYVWSQFDQTLQSGIAVATEGAMLVPVPEPQTWAMWLAGLGLLGWSVRRAGVGVGVGVA